MVEQSIKSDKSVRRLELVRGWVSVSSYEEQDLRISYLAPCAVEDLNGQSHAFSEVLVCLHQTPSHAESYRQLIEYLTQLVPDLFVIALDTPGFGKSDPLPSVDRLDLSELSSPLGQVIAELSKVICRPIHFCGHHTGASLCLAIASRLSEQIASLSLIGLPAFLPEDTEFFKKYTQDLRRQIHGEQAILKERQCRKALDSFSEADRLEERLAIITRAKDPCVDQRVVKREVSARLQAGERLTDVYDAVWCYHHGQALKQIKAPLQLISPVDDMLINYQESTLNLLAEIGIDPTHIVISGGGYAPESATVELSSVLLDWIRLHPTQREGNPLSSAANKERRR